MLARELGKAHDVRVFNFTRQYPALLFPGKTQYVAPGDEAPETDSIRILDTVNPFSWGRTARAVRKWKPDLVLVRYWMSWFAPSLGYVTRRLRKDTTVLSILDNVIPHESHWFDTPLTRYFLSGSDGCVTLCNEVGADLHALRPDLPATVIPHPVYSQFGEALPRKEAAARLGIDPGKRTLLFFGLIREYKGLDILLEAFGSLGEEYQLVVAGEPYGSFERYQALLDACPGRGRIHLFTRYIPDSEVRDYFSAADVTVLPYRSATQSGISAVSYAFGVPMIVTPVGGLKETIGERGTGLVTERVDAEDVVRAIRRFFDEPATAEQCRKAIREELKRLSWSAFAAQLTEFAASLQKN